MYFLFLRSAKAEPMAMGTAPLMTSKKMTPTKPKPTPAQVAAKAEAKRIVVAKKKATIKKSFQGGKSTFATGMRGGR